jgi:YidC/Oxa1 family membrane protein insertase
MDQVWNWLILNPMVNVLLWLYGLFGNSFLLAILVFTAITRLILWPLTATQMKSTAATQELQPKLKKLQEKYKDNSEELNRRTMEMYREAGVNPLGGCLPLLVQFPILIGLYQALRASLAAAPLELLTLSQHIYHPVPDFLKWLPDAASLIPLNSHFAWMNLASPDPYFILPVLVVTTTFLQNKLLTPPSTDPQQGSMNASMQLMMPLMIGWFSLTFPSGLSIYWVLANLIGVGQYSMMGRASIKNLLGTGPDGRFSLRAFMGFPAPVEQKRFGPGSRSKKK